MSELISGKEAKLAWANDKTVQIRNTIVGEDFYDLAGDNAQLGVFDIAFYQFRLKPCTITLNVEIEKPKEIVLCAITGAVGLVYGDIDKAKSVKEKLEVAFNAN